MQAPKKIKISFILCATFFLIFTSYRQSVAATDGSVTFTWKANPPEENVTGYRLYYGPNSRFFYNGLKKHDFSYKYCINFATSQRCSGENYTNCKDLGSEILKCNGLYRTTPECTLSKLSGINYFSLTAYNNLGESAYTKELQYDVQNDGPTTKPAITFALSLLLD